MNKIVILGSVPSQKNRKRIYTNRKTGKPFIASDETVKDWQKDALLQLKGKRPVQVYPISLTAVFFVRDDRRHDLDNMVAGCMDILVKAGILQDDDCKHVETLTLQFGGLEPLNPRVEIFID